MQNVKLTDCDSFPQVIEELPHQEEEEEEDQVGREGGGREEDGREEDGREGRQMGAVVSVHGCQTSP